MRHQPQVHAARLDVAQVTVGGGVLPALAAGAVAEARVGPVLVVAVVEVRAHPGRDGLHVEARPGRPVGTQCRSIAGLAIAPGFVRERVAGVVQRPRVVAVVRFDAHQRQPERQRLAGLPVEPRARGGLVDGVGVVAAEEIVLDVAVAAVAVDCEPRAEVGRQRAAGHRAQRAAAVFGHAAFHARHRPVGRCRRADVDQAGHRAGAEGGALRAAQHLDLLDVEQRARVAEPAEVDAVDVEPDRGIHRVDELAALADAADLHEAPARGARTVVHVRRRVQQLLEMVGLALADQRRGQHADARRDRIHGFGQQPRGDHDLLEPIGRRGGPRVRRAEHDKAQGQRAPARAACRRKWNVTHPRPPYRRSGPALADIGAHTGRHALSYPFAGIIRIRFEGFTSPMPVSQVLPTPRRARSIA
jgi:hypothetical protein